MTEQQVDPDVQEALERAAAEQAALRAADPAPYVEAARHRWNVITTDGYGEPFGRMYRIHKDIRWLCRRMVSGFGPDVEDWASQDIGSDLERAIEKAVQEYAARVLAYRAAKEASA